jgi:hypothetical protein
MKFDTVKWLELCMIIFGLSCVVLSSVLALRFKRVGHKLAKALFKQLMAEAIIGFVTVVFAVTSWLDLYSQLNPRFVLFLRFIIFGTGAATSVNLWFKVRAIEDGNEKRSDRKP